MFVVVFCVCFFFVSRRCPKTIRSMHHNDETDAEKQGGKNNSTLVGKFD